MTLTAIQDKLGIPNRAADLERRLDDAVADSFPASDPVQLSQPHDPHELGVRRPGMSPMTYAILLGGGLLAMVAIIALRR